MDSTYLLKLLSESQVDNFLLTTSECYTISYISTNNDKINNTLRKVGFIAHSDFHLNRKVKAIIAVLKVSTYHMMFISSYLYRIFEKSIMLLEYFWNNILQKSLIIHSTYSSVKCPDEFLQKCSRHFKPRLIFPLRSI